MCIYQTTLSIMNRTIKAGDATLTAKINSNGEIIKDISGTTLWQKLLVIMLLLTVLYFA